MKEIETKIISYEGNCPRCNTSQKNNNKNFVDTPCSKCSEIIRNERVEKRNEHLIGSIITKIEASDGEIVNITIKKDDKEYNINSEGGDYGTNLVIY